MSDGKFPLCESVELRVRGPNGDNLPPYGSLSYIHASDVESLLAKGVRMHTCSGTGDSWYPATNDLTHVHTQALLIDIKPIAKPERSATLTESQVSDAIRDASRAQTLNIDLIIDRLFDTNKEGGR